MNEKGIGVGLRGTALTVIALFALSSCSSQGERDGRGRTDAPTSSSTRGDAGGDPRRADDGGRPSGDAAVKARGDAPVVSLATCGLAGSKLSLPEIIAADVTHVDGRLLVAAVLARPRSEPLDLEGSEPLPEMRSAYLLGIGDDGTAEVRHVTDDPGPVRDHFGRRVYERLAGTRVVCDRSGCLIVLIVERHTPGTPTFAYTALVQTLDDQGLPQGEGSKLRRLAQQPDRGESIASCLGVSNEGYLFASAVEGGRGRLLWLDRRATPLDMSYVPEGFDSCTIWPLGLELEVATGRAEGVSIHGFGRSESDDGGPGPWRPELSDDARWPILIAAGGTRMLVFAEGDAVRALSSARREPFDVFDFGARVLTATPSGEALLAAAVDETKRISLARLDASSGVTARSSLSKIKASRLWLTASDQNAWLGWADASAKSMSLQRLICPVDERSADEGAGEAASKVMTSDELDRADRGSVPQLLSLAIEARREDHNYRAAWLLERAYHLDPSDPQRLVDAAGLLTEIRYTKSALRQLERLSKLDGDATKALRSACNDRDFERLWAAGEFQRITGCRAPAQPSPDAGDEEDQQAIDEGS